jgi:hypothetical protein
MKCIAPLIPNELECINVTFIHIIIGTGRKFRSLMCASTPLIYGCKKLVVQVSILEGIQKPALTAVATNATIEIGISGTDPPSSSGDEGKSFPNRTAKEVLPPAKHKS